VFGVHSCVFVALLMSVVFCVVPTTTTGAIPPARSKHTAVYREGAIYIFGGDDGREKSNEMYKYDIGTQYWTLLKVYASEKRLTISKT